MPAIDWLPTSVLTTDQHAHRFLKEAYQYASATSHDPDTQNGSVLIEDARYRNPDPTRNPPGMLISRGANRFPDGIVETPERWERPTKYDYVQHAERDAILTAASLGKCTRNAILYCTWYACKDCALAIIGAKIQRVVGHKQMFDKTPDRWKESIQKGFEMMHEANVRCEMYDGLVFEENDSFRVRFNGEDWCP